jgi:hypothetical protein
MFGRTRKRIEVTFTPSAAMRASISGTKNESS